MARGEEGVSCNLTGEGRRVERMLRGKSEERLEELGNVGDLRPFMCVNEQHQRIWKVVIISMLVGTQLHLGLHCVFAFSFQNFDAGVSFIITAPCFRKHYI